MIQRLTDQFGRTHDYLRISLTERCNLRCTYCMPEEGIELRDRAEFMSQEELLQIAEKFVSFGIKKIRLTGGEPLIKKNFSGILSDLSQLPVELAITTNAALLDKYIDDLKKAKLNRINISLDSLNEARFNRISRRKDFKRIRENINLAIREGFIVKLNVVLMKNENEEEIDDFIRLTEHDPIGIRFIEFMPFQGNRWDWSRKVSFDQIMLSAENTFGKSNIKQLKGHRNDTAKNFQVRDHKGNFGIISTLTNPFCDGCNRIRLTADGKLKNCLFSSDETDLLNALRLKEPIDQLIIDNINRKKLNRAGINSFESNDGKDIFSGNRSMISIGG